MLEKSEKSLLRVAREQEERPLPPAFQPLPPPAPTPVPPQAKPRGTALSRRLWLSFLAAVALPIAACAYFLYAVAADQYGSTVAFSVQTEEVASPFELLGGLADMGTASASATDILYDFARSQHLVAAVDARVDLAALWHQPRDPVFGFRGDTTIESLRDHWARMVTVRHDPATGLITVTARAFGAEDAQTIARAIHDESATMINDLSAAAHQEATAFARADNEAAREDLRQARLDLTEYRTRTQIVDPSADVAGRLGLVASLQEQLATAMLDYQTLASTERPNRAFTLERAQERIAILRDLIAQERAAVTTGAQGGATYAELVAEYERLKVDLTFAEETYVAARASLDAARADALRTSRHLAAHIPATLAETPEHPRRAMLLALFAVALALGWAVVTLTVLSLRDRA